MKTTLLAALAITFFISIGLIPGEASAQKTKNITEKRITRSPGSEPIVFENLHDTMIVSKDGKDTTIIRTTQDGKEKKVTVRKIITSGNDKANLDRFETETETEMEEPGNKGSRTIRIEKRITIGGGADSVVTKKISLRDLRGEDEPIFDEPSGAKHKTIKIITHNGKEIETDGDENTTIIYLDDDAKCDHHNVKKGDGKHRKVYVIEEDKNTK